MKKSEQTTKKTWFYQFALVLVRLFSNLVYPCKLINPEALHVHDAPFILVSNHQSMMDPLLLASKFHHHEIHFVGKRELTSFGPVKWVVEHLHMIAVSRHNSDLNAMRSALATLKKGHVLGIFPEGTRQQGQPMVRIESGTSFLALRSKAPLLPVLIIGRPRPFRRTRMVIGQAIPYEDLLSSGLDKLSSDTLNERMRQSYRQMHEKYNKKTI